MDILATKVLEIMKRCGWVVDLNDSVEKVAQVMTLNDLSLVPVVNFHAPDIKGRCVGMLDWNIIERFRKSHGNLRETPAWKICTARPLEVSPEMTIIEAANLMLARDNDCAVVIEDDAIAGYVSSIDVLNVIMDGRKHDDKARLA